MLLLGTAICLFSCKKETAASDNIRLLTERTWAYDKFGIDQDLDGDIDIPTPIEACTLDDIVRFNTDGSGSFNQGSNLCYPDFPQSTPFEWQFHTNETQVEYGGTIHTILALDEIQLKIYTEENNVRHILSYKH